MVSTRRRIQRNKTQKYAVGDKVEVVRGDSLAVGFLLSKAEDENGKKLSRNSSNRNGNAPPGTTHWVVSVEGGSEDEEVISEKGLGRVLEANDSDESATFERDSGKQNTLPGKSSTMSVNHKALSNSAGSKSQGNNQKKTGTSSTTVPNTTPTTTISPQHPSPSETAEWSRKRPPPRPKKELGDDEVVEIRLNTGTLFMYRGKNRRVEYIQRV